MNRISKKYILINVLIFIVLAIIGVLFYMHSVKKVREESNKINQEMNARIMSSTRTVYKALADISNGQVITEDLISMDSNALTDDGQELLMSTDDIGKVATVDIHAGEIIKSGMVTDSLSKDWQETELNCIWLSTNLKQYDYVDVRILYPNGTDYIVAAKKSIKKIRLKSNNVFLWLTEAEILNIDSAIVDANLHGAKIYTTRYVKPEIEKANKVTYQPSASIIDLLNSDANVLLEAKQNLSKMARADMEQKLEAFKSDKAEQDKTEQEEEYNFHLDTTTNAGAENKSDTNNGYDGVDDEMVGGSADGARNVDGTAGVTGDSSGNTGVNTNTGGATGGQ